MRLDAVDHAILSTLRGNARQTLSEIGAEAWSFGRKATGKVGTEFEILYDGTDDLVVTPTYTLANEFTKTEWTNQWGGSVGEIASPMLAQVLREAAPDLVAALFTQVGIQVVQHIRNNRY